MDIDSVCLSYRHDFGLMPEMDKQRIRAVAESWLHAFEKHGFGYLGDAEAKHPPQPGELTRELIESAISTMATSNAADAIFCRILSDRAATEARVRAECLEGARLSRQKREQEIKALTDRCSYLTGQNTGFQAQYERDSKMVNDLCTTIADLEKRLENAVEIDWSKYDPEVRTLVAYCPETNTLEGTIATRPTPAKHTPEQMAEAWVLAFEYEEESTMGAWQSLAKRLAEGESIETLYAEIKGGE